MSSDCGIAHRSFHGASGSSEHFISVNAQGDLSFPDQIAQIEERYCETQRSLGLSPQTAICRRLFISDAMNQADLVRNSSLVHETFENPVAVSLVQQPPLPSAKIALLAYHVAGGGPSSKRRLSPKNVLVEKNGHRHLWTTGLCAGEHGSETSASVQTRQIFNDLIATLKDQRASLRDNCVRTWLYLKDVDVFYQGMVDSRGAVFAEQGLTPDTHYIASTGIEGACAHRFDLVAMDAYCNLDLQPGQVSYLNDFERLCPTKDYNVHFERGTRVAYADRTHHFISGTASIDKSGQVVHLGDVLSQLDHTLDNIEALLHSGTASLADLVHLIVYLRDPADCTRVRSRLAEKLPDLPIMIVQGAVCRPQWLVEIEGVAITNNDERSLPAF